MSNSKYKNLEKWGWKSSLDRAFSKFSSAGFIPGRVVKESRGVYAVETPNGRGNARVTGAFQYRAVSKADYPTIGDWVALQYEGDMAMIHGVCSRLTSVSRKVAGVQIVEQVIASNIDKLFIVLALDGGRNFNLRLLERLMVIAWDSGAMPVILLNKSDLCDDIDLYLSQAEEVAPGAEVYPVSAELGDGMDSISSIVKPGETIAFIGQSGVGKSSLINYIAGEEIMKTGEQRDSDRRGCHTTTHKELLLLKNGAMLIDCPGMREIQLWGDESGVDDTFRDIMDIAQECKFSDCNHNGEPGCAVQTALEDGSLKQSRFESYLKLKKELNYLRRKEDRSYAMEQKKRWIQRVQNLGKIVY